MSTGARFQCDAPHGQATLLGWKTPKAKHNQTNDTLIMRDGAHVLTETIFPPQVGFPITGHTKLASLYVQTPYDIDGLFSEALKSIPAMVDKVIHGSIKPIKLWPI